MIKIVTILIFGGSIAAVIANFASKRIVREVGMILMWLGVLTATWSAPLFGEGISEGINPGLILSLAVPVVCTVLHLFRIAVYVGWVKIDFGKKDVSKDSTEEQ